MRKLGEDDDLPVIQASKSEKILMQWRLQHFDTKNGDLTNQTYDGISGIIPGYNWMPPI